MERNLTYFLVFSALMLSSCIEKPVYPSEPVIAYEDFIKYGDPSEPDSVETVISFTDNEGDIGLEQSDKNGIFKDGNLWMIYYYDSANTGNWITYDSPFIPGIDTLKIPYRVPPVLPIGDPTEPIKGLIYVKQEEFIKIHDKIKYVVYMYDKAMHRSNSVETPVITFP